MDLATPAPAPVADAPAPEPKTPESGTLPATPKASILKESTEPRKKYKVKVDKEELEVDEDELVAGYQSRKASGKAWQAAAEKEKQILALFRRIKDNPEEGLEALLSNPALGLNLDDIATKRLMRKIELEQMTPEQRESDNMRRELEKFRSEKEQAEKTKLDAETSALKREYAQRVETEIVEAIKPSGLPVSKFTFKRVAFYLKEGLARGYKLTAADVVPLVKQDYEQEHHAFFSGYDDEGLEKALGEEVAERLSKRRIAKLKGQLQPQPVAAAAEEQDEPQVGETPRPKPAKKAPARKETFSEAAARIARGGK